jgi:predicted secreted hydrolase
MMMKKLTLFFCMCALTAPGAEAWKNAEPGWKYEWPRDHRTHPEFKTEWWYFTGNLRAKDGRRFGYQLTFFRHGIRSPGSEKVASRFVKDDIQFGHFAITDVKKGAFHYTQSVKRGAFGEAGFSDDSSLAWLGSWRLELSDDGGFIAKAQDGERTLELTMENTKPLAVHGENGISSKAEEPGHASHYYSATRLKSRGHLRTNGETIEVEGESWFDHEWATNQLAKGQSGWDWFSIQFDDGSELMLYQLRREDGSIDGASSGSWIDRDGRVLHLNKTDISMVPRRFWTSKKTGGKYPLEWQLKVAKVGLEVAVTTPIEAQELVLKPVAYWEGLIDIAGTREGKRVTGHGYLELTGYAGALVGLMAPK